MGFNINSCNTSQLQCVIPTAMLTPLYYGTNEVDTIPNLSHPSQRAQIVCCFIERQTLRRVKCDQTGSRRLDSHQALPFRLHSRVQEVPWAQGAACTKCSQ
eukprot:m.358291 g.358291  ORF g.358291 m.358291 type:complete len:101 (+) comp18103_c0_seq1:617-919(+)